MTRARFKKVIIHPIRTLVFPGTVIGLSLALLLIGQTARASTTGKIAGEVIDNETMLPVAGALVEVIGAPYSTETDEDGEYYIMEVPAGSYTLRITADGYNVITQKNVRVLLDLTTPVDVELVARTAEIMEPIVVTAERPTVQRDLTATRYTVTAEEMMYLPNSINLADVLANMSGTVTDRDNELHIRGGRAGEVTYIFDGVIVNDPITRDLGMRIVPDFLEEVNLTSGGFPAEYGEAGSAVVNAVTREGKNFFTGSFKAYDGATQTYDPTRGKFGDLQRSDNQAVQANFSGPLDIIGLKNSTFFVAAEGLRDAGYLPHNFKESISLSGKLTFRPAPQLKLTAVSNFHNQDAEFYEHRDVNGISYDFNLDGLPITHTESDFITLRMDYSHDERTIMQASASHFRNEFKLAPAHLFDVYWNKWPGFVADSTGKYDQANGTLHVDNYNYAPEYGFTGYTYGDDFNPRYNYSKTTYNALNANLTRQIDKRNQLKLGGEFRRYNIFWDSKQFFNATPFGEIYEQSPDYGFAYIQHKLEYKDVIINAGLRYDHLSSVVNYFDVKNNPGEIQIIKTPRTSSSKSQLSPRLGVSHPVSENTILRFNYGFFFQPPKFWTMFTNLDAETNSVFPLLGNPDLKPEKTIAYELGLNHAFNNDVSMDVTAYYKDIENLIAARQVAQGGGGTVVTTFVNEDFSTVQGLDVKVTKRRSRYFYGSLNYSLMFARGVSPEETYAYYNIIGVSGESLPQTDYPLDFDQRHTLTLNLDVRTPRNWKGRFFGTVPMSGAWGMNLVGRYGSGLPYSKFNQKTGERVSGINAFRMPFVFTVDARFNRDFFVGDGGSYFSLFFEVENLFNRRNIVNVYRTTGLPDDDGVNFTDGGALVTSTRAAELYDLITNDPQNFGPPRTIRTGLQFNF